MSLPQPVKVQPIEDGFDRLNITEVRKRFLQINSDRLLRTRNALNHRQEVFLDALPLLFHCNHPMLPGFVSHSTPCGVSEYKPTKRDIASGKSLARSFCLTGGHQSDNIWSIFLMGSVGTLAHTTHSDFDVWLCHRPDLSQEGCAELEEKCKRISCWAAELRLEVHFFLMNCETFKAGTTLTMDEESSGTAQRALLLDEFYRTALHICGRLPLWWFTASVQEQSYDQITATLLDKRFIRPNTTIDFGGLSQIPAGEYLGAGVWQLYKAIGSPYKSVLKLLTMEAYVAEYGSAWPLAMEYKNLVYEGELNVDELDPYLRVYRRIEHYLTERNEPERLEFARRCFYFKINKPLSRKPSRMGKSWQRLVLENLVAQWGWSDEYIANLDRRPHWKATDVREERNMLVRSLNASYDALQQFANDSGVERAISADELHVLGRKLQAAFERRPDKVDFINPGISKDVSESILKFVQSSALSDDAPQGKKVWQLFGNETGADTPLRQASGPVDLLLWCYLNQIIDGHIQFDLSLAPEVTETQLRRTLAKVQQWLPLPLASPTQAHFAKSAVPQRTLMLLNVANEARSGLSEMGIQRLSGRNDPMRYGSFEDNLVLSVDIITQNSWQELECQRFEGKYALLSALQAYVSLCMPGSHQAPPELSVDCLGLNHAVVIAKRVSQWFHEIASCYYTGIKPASTRYLFEMGNQYFSLQFKGPKMHVLAHHNSEELIRYLAEPQRKYSPIVVDSYALHNHPLRLITKRLSAKSVHVFYQRIEHHLRMYFVDERGSLLQFSGEYSPKLHALNALYIFLHAVFKRIPDNPLQKSYTEFGMYPIEFHELKVDAQKRFHLTPRAITPNSSTSPTINITAIIKAGTDNRLEYSFDCLGQLFDWQQLQQDVFYTAAQFIQSQRQSKTRYRMYITDLDLDGAAHLINPDGPLQACHYLRVKQDVEHKLMMAARAF